jgi:hypothetical protein
MDRHQAGSFLKGTPHFDKKETAMAPAGKGESPITSSISKLVDDNAVLLEQVMQKYQEETQGFIERRLHHNTDAVEHLRDCKGVVGPFAVESTWWTDMVSDYLEQSAKTLELWIDLAGGSTKNLIDCQLPLFQTIPSYPRNVGEGGKQEERRAA